MRSIEQLVNEQVLRWTEEQRRSSPPTSRQPLRPSPVICISREFGAQAGLLAEEVGARLDFDVVDQHLVDEIAKQAHVRRRIVESLDERIQRGIRQSTEELMDSERFNASDYLRNLSLVVLTLARHGKSIIIGR